jgi:hypothetical protein
MWKRIVAAHAYIQTGILVLAIVAAIIYLWRSKPSAPIYVREVGPTVYVKIPHSVETVKTVTVPGPERVVLVPSVIVSEKMRWPELGKDNVLSVGEVPPYRGKTSIAAVADIKDNTMTTRLISRQEPMPFWGWEREWHGGLWYGAAGRNKVQGEVEFLPMRIGPVFPSVKAVAGMEEGGNVNGQLLLGVRF